MHANPSSFAQHPLLIDYTSNVFVKESQIVSDYFDTIAERGTTVDVHDVLLRFTLDGFGE